MEPERPKPVLLLVPEDPERVKWERAVRHLRSLGQPLKFMPPAKERP